MCGSQVGSTPPTGMLSSCICLRNNCHHQGGYFSVKVDTFYLVTVFFKVMHSLLGEEGIGKSSTLAMLALDWAEDKAQPELKQFDFVFMIPLKDIDGNMTIEELILKYHSGFQVNEVPQHHVKLILKGTTESKVLLMLDEYEMYEKGTNIDVDSAISHTLGHCFLLITSRLGQHMDKEDLDQMNEEIKITGLGDDNIRECTRKYLDNNSKMVEDLLEKSAGTNIYGLLRIPAILLMVCTLLQEDKLTQSKTDVISGVLRMCIDRTTIKTIGKQSKEVRDLDKMFNLLGELSWMSNSAKKKEVLIRKVVKLININTFFCQFAI